MKTKTKVERCWQFFLSLIRWVQDALYSLWTFCAHRIKRAVYGRRPQAPQPIISAGLRGVLWQCKVHLLPICGTITLSYLNLAGYFIGSNYLGLSQKIYQDLDALLLQITAKLMEIAVIASTSIVVMDLLRESLLYKPQGLPLGLLSAGFRFSDLSYFWTPDFLWGSFASRRIVLTAVLVIAGLLAVLSGPASALLMIPSRTDWPAGGATFYLAGSTDSLWPTNLTSASTGIPACDSPSETIINGLWLNMSSCLWNGYPAIAQAFQALHFNTYENQIEMSDGIMKRMLSVQIKGRVTDTWALGIDMSTGAYSTELASIWYNQALFGAPLAKTKYRNFQYRERNSTMTAVRSTLPVVRTNCNYYENVNFLNMTNSGPQYQSALTDVGFVLSTPTGYNSSRITATWRAIQNNESVGITVDSQGNYVSGWPSAFLDIQVPYEGQSSDGVFFACSIDARWVAGNVVGTNVGYLSGMPLQQAVIPTHSDLDNNNFPAINDGNWRTVRLEGSWLDSLTPVLGSNNSGWNTLSSATHAAGIDNSTGLIVAYVDAVGSLEGVISSLVVDGMSRVGYADNGGTYTLMSDIEYLIYIDPEHEKKTLNDLLSGSLELPRSDAQSTQLRWGVTITGLAYSGNSTSYYLSLALLYVHLLLAILHTVYSVLARRSSSAWESLTDLIVLCINSSPASARLQNTSGGITEHALYKHPVWIRVIKSNTVISPSSSPSSTFLAPQMGSQPPSPSGAASTETTPMLIAPLQLSTSGSSANISLNTLHSVSQYSNTVIPSATGPSPPAQSRPCKEEEALQLIVGEHADLVPQEYGEVHAKAVYRRVTR
ncbi:hypothetical protein UA08_01689 [Talaromyces atroroseus]|uniref:Uncharacterized protein n=1 Tax=Talaromyces atroroseus TaxID=1441469 RepID=A0A1Q5QAS3_TALAT|nr:hypothetical protein UA08_01689 [Talaromyces atroroseus]OKL63026.1 hypothetical protein UA08_01689 [Talaromyces atroroseus]